MRSKRALVCAPLMPEWDRESGSRRIFHLIQFLREAGWAVSFAAQNGRGGERYARTLQQLGVATYPGFGAEIEEVIETGDFDLALVAFWYLGEALLPMIRRVSPATRVVVDSIDLHFVRNARRVFRASEDARTSRLLDLEYASEMMREMNVYSAADAVLTVSQKEADLINDLAADPMLAYAVHDSESLTPSPVPFAERKGMLFVGNFRHPPNVQAVEHLCRDILPLVDPSVTAQHPVYIVGNGLDDTIREYASDLPHVHMVGWVPSVVPYLERARISVIPLLYGAGTKRKLLQALLIGTPTVSTSIGTEGLNLEDGKHVLVADDADTFARAVTRLLQEEELWQQLTCQGRDYITAIHDREAARIRMRQVVSTVLAKKIKFVKLATPNGELHRHLPDAHYRQLIARIQEVVKSSVPPNTTVMVVSKGDEDLLRLQGRRAWHFPQAEKGSYSGYYPANSADAIKHLEALREKGGEFLLFPSTAFWWLEHYAEFKQHLEGRYRVAAREKHTCVVFDLREQGRATEAPAS